MKGHSAPAQGPMAGHGVRGQKDCFRKTKLCKFNAAGRCTRRGNCDFAHDTRELKPLPDLYRTKPCPEFVITGICPWGSTCTFAHRPDELRHTDGSFSWAETCQKMRAGQAVQGSEEPPSISSHVARLEQLALEAREAAAFMQGLEAFLMEKSGELDARDTAAKAERAPVPECNTDYSGWGPYPTFVQERKSIEESLASAEDTKFSPWVSGSGNISRQSTDDPKCALEEFACFSRQTTPEAYESFSEELYGEWEAGQEQQWQVARDREGTDGPEQGGQEPVAITPVHASPRLQDDARFSTGQKQRRAVRMIAGLRIIKKNSFLEVLGDDELEDPRKIHSDGEV